MCLALLQEAFVLENFTCNSLGKTLLINYCTVNQCPVYVSDSVLFFYEFIQYGLQPTFCLVCSLCTIDTSLLSLEANCVLFENNTVAFILFLLMIALL